MKDTKSFEVFEEETGKKVEAKIGSPAAVKLHQWAVLSVKQVCHIQA